RNKPAEVRTQLLPPQRNRPFAPENYCLFQTAIHDGAIHYAGKAVPLLPENAQLIADLAEFRTGKRYHRKAKSLARRGNYFGASLKDLRDILDRAQEKYNSTRL